MNTFIRQKAEETDSDRFVDNML